jgi:hypothetical protein
MPARSVQIYISNNTDFELTYVDSQLCHGQWTSGGPKTIPRKTQDSFESESDGIATGTEGWVKYQLKNTDEPNGAGDPVFSWVYAYWDNPFVPDPNWNPLPTVAVDIGGYVLSCDNHNINQPNFPPGYALSLVQFNVDPNQWSGTPWGLLTTFGSLAIPVVGLANYLVQMLHGNTDNLIFVYILHKRTSVAQFLPLKYNRSLGLRPFLAAAKTNSLRKMMGL